MFEAEAKEADRYVQQIVDQNNNAIVQEIKEQIIKVKQKIFDLLDQDKRGSIVDKWEEIGAFSRSTGQINLSKVQGNLISRRMREALNVEINALQASILKALQRTISINNVRIEKRGDELVVAVYEVDHDKLVTTKKFGEFEMKAYALKDNINLDDEGKGPKKPNLDSTYLSVLSQQAYMKNRNSPYIVWKNSTGNWTKIKVENKSALAEFYIFHFYKTPDEQFRVGYPDNFIIFFFGQSSMEKLAQQVDNQSGFFLEDVFKGLNNGVEEYVGVKFGEHYGLYSIVKILQNLDQLQAALQSNDLMNGLSAFQQAIEIDEDSLQYKVTVLDEAIDEQSIDLAKKWAESQGLEII